MTSQVSIEYELNSEEAEVLWGLYDASFDDLNLASPCMQRAWNHEEFIAGMSDPSVTKAVLRDGETAEMLAISIYSSNLDLFPWVSQRFYEKNYVRQYSEGVIFYTVTTLSLNKRMGHMKKIMNVMTSDVGQRRGMVIFDLCETLTAIDWQERVRDAANEVMPCTLEEVGMQRYFVIRAE